MSDTENAKDAKLSGYPQALHVSIPAIELEELRAKADPTDKANSVGRNMNFKKFCDYNGYRAKVESGSDNLEFKAAKKAWFNQQKEIERLENKIRAFKIALNDL